MGIFDEQLRAFQKRGWITFSAPSTTSIVELGQQLGQLTSSLRNGLFVDTLRPLTSEHARRRSMSSRYGKGSFPFHTDCAHFKIPPRYVILRCVKATNQCPTLICEMDTLKKRTDLLRELRRGVWVVNGGRGTFYSSVCSVSSSGEQLIRFDPCCMRLASQSFISALEAIGQVVSTSTITTIDWKPSLGLLLDNWKVMHARADASQVIDERILERVLITQIGETKYGLEL